MIHKIDYDFSEIIFTIANMKQRTPTPEDLAVLKTELNRFFDDSSCKEVLYTTNTDKMFFGIKLIAMIDADDIYDYLVDTDKLRISKYAIEIDSKLFDPIMDLTPREITAVILREIFHFIGDSSPVESARDAMNAYLASNKTHLHISQSVHYKEILAFGLKDYLSKSDSMFYIGDPSEVDTDEFLASYGFGDDIGNAYRKIFNNNIKLYENCNISKFIVFDWTLDIYRNLANRRVEAIKTMTELKALTGSRLEKMEMDNVIKRVHRIDDDSIINESNSNGIRARIKEKLKKSRLNSLRTIDNTYYEISMQVKNVEDENDALYLMRQINNSIAIIDEYRNSKDADKDEVEKWNNIMDRFVQLREKLTSTVVYKNKNFGLFVNYPDIVENRY